MKNWERFQKHMQEQSSLVQILELLAWDQETYMPRNAIEQRAKQSAMISGLLHKQKTSTEFGDLIHSLEAESTEQTVAIQRIQNDFNRAKKIPTDLVERLTESRSIATQSWAKAKENNDLSAFLPALQTVIENTKEYAHCHPNAEHLYDNLLEEYDPGVRTKSLDTLFQRLEAELAPYVQEELSKEQAEKLDIFIPKEAISRINHRILEGFGFCFESGRLDSSSHPFTVGMSPHDVRLTTRNIETDFLGSIGGTIHEAGHGLYEQGLPVKLSNLGLCKAAGCGLHESQSRFYENMIGKSFAFYQWLSPIIYKESGLIISPKRLYKAANVVRPSLLRVYADETTYNLHIIIRYQIEKALIEDSLRIEDINEAWNDRYERLLGIRPDDAKDGMLQDIHWSSGLFGYFPSYTIGNLYSASFRFMMESDIPDIWKKVSKGDFGAALSWLRSNIHSKGHVLSQDEIVCDAVGTRDHVADLMKHFRERHQKVEELR